MDEMKEEHEEQMKRLRDDHQRAIDKLSGQVDRLNASAAAQSDLILAGEVVFAIDALYRKEVRAHDRGSTIGDVVEERKNGDLPDNVDRAFTRFLAAHKITDGMLALYADIKAERGDTFHSGGAKKRAGVTVATLMKCVCDLVGRENEDVARQLIAVLPADRPLDPR